MSFPESRFLVVTRRLGFFILGGLGLGAFREMSLASPRISSSPFITSGRMDPRRILFLAGGFTFFQTVQSSLISGELDSLIFVGERVSDVFEIVDSEYLIARFEHLSMLPFHNTRLRLRLRFLLHLPNSSMTILLRRAAEKLKPLTFLTSCHGSI